VTFIVSPFAGWCRHVDVNRKGHGELAKIPQNYLSCHHTPCTLQDANAFAFSWPKRD